MHITEKPMNRVVLGAVSLLLLGIGAYLLLAPKAPEPQVLQGEEKLQWGTYAGTPGGIEAFEELVGKTVDIAATFVGFDEPFPTEFAATSAGKGKVLLIFLEPSTGHEEVLSGMFDDDLRAFAAAAAEYGQPIILSPFNEPNLDEEIWGFGVGSNTKENFIEAWRHIHGIISQAPNIKWAIAFNNISIPEDSENTFETLYPGDAYVDYVGVDGFNGMSDEDPWASPQEVFDSSIEELKKFNKPIYIFSVSSKEDPRKAQWITDFFAWMKSRPEIKGFVWFNENKERDWRIDSDEASLAAFIQGLN